MSRARRFATTLLTKRGLSAQVLAQVLLIAVALVAIGSEPIGVSTPEQTLGSGARLAGMEAVGDARVLLVAQSGRLQVQVAYRGPKGWLSATFEPGASNAAASWAASDGGGPVPAFSAVYGRSGAERVTVAWDDGAADSTAFVDRGTFLVVRPGVARSRRTTFVAPGGAAAQQVDGP